MDGFRERVTRIRELLISFEPATLELVKQIGQVGPGALTKRRPT